MLYLISAKALLSGAYCQFTAVGCPPLVMITPGWPLLLAPLALVTDAPAAFQAFGALLLAACPAALWLWLRRRVDATAALLAALVFASSGIALAQAGTAMSEAPYLLLFLAALAAAENARHGRAGALALLLSQVRPAGLSALPGLAARALLNRDRAAAARVLLPSVLGAAAWSAWSWSKSGSVQEADEFVVSYAGLPWTRPLRVAADNAVFYLKEWGGSALPPAFADGPAALALGLALAAGAAWGLCRVLRRDRADAAAWSLLGACALHAVWAWQYERYLLPLLPLLLWALIEGLGPRAKPALGVLLAAQLVFQVLPRLGRPSPWAEPELAATYAWLKARSEPGALASALHARDGWHSGRPSLPLPDEKDSAAFAARLKGARARFVLRQDGLGLGLSESRDARLGSALARAFRHLEDPRHFRKTYENTAERTAIYETR